MSYEDEEFLAGAMCSHAYMYVFGHPNLDHFTWNRFDNIISETEMSAKILQQDWDMREPEKLSITGPIQVLYD